MPEPSLSTGLQSRRPASDHDRAEGPNGRKARQRTRSGKRQGGIWTLPEPSPGGHLPAERSGEPPTDIPSTSSAAVKKSTAPTWWQPWQKVGAVDPAVGVAPSRVAGLTTVDARGIVVAATADCGRR